MGAAAIADMRERAGLRPSFRGSLTPPAEDLKKADAYDRDHQADPSPLVQSSSNAEAHNKVAGQPTA